MPWVLLKQSNNRINKTANLTLKCIHIYMILMFMEGWRLAAGCEDCDLVDYGRTRVKGSKNILILMIFVAQNGI